MDLFRADPLRVLPLLLVEAHLPPVPRHDQGQAHAGQPRRAGAADQPGMRTKDLPSYSDVPIKVTRPD